MTKSPVIFLGAGPGDPELVTVKGKRAIEEADLILYAGSLVSEAVLAWGKTNAERINTAPLALEEIASHMIRGFREGRRVVRVHSGDPALFGAIQEQMDLLDAEGIPYEVIPGVTAAFATAAAIRRELTIPKLVQTVILTRAAGRTSVPEPEALDSLATHGATMAIYLSAARIREVVRDLIGPYPPDTPVVVAHRVSWPDERILTGTLSDIAQQVEDAGITRQAIILVGPALRGHKTRSSLYDKRFSHGFRPGEGG